MSLTQETTKTLFQSYYLGDLGRIFSTGGLPPSWTRWDPCAWFLSAKKAGNFPESSNLINLDLNSSFPKNRDTITVGKLSAGDHWSKSNGDFDFSRLFFADWPKGPEETNVR